MKKFFILLSVIFISFFIFSSCGNFLNTFMDEIDPPLLSPGDIEMPENKNWYMHGIYDDQGNMYCDYVTINWTESDNASYYEIYYYSSEEEISFSVAEEKAIYRGAVEKTGNWVIALYDYGVYLDYYNNYTYITVVPVSKKDKDGKEYKIKGKPLTNYWIPYKLRDHQVTYISDYGTAPKAITVKTGTKLTSEQLPVMENEDMIFDGWYDGDTKVEVDTYIVNKSVTLTAKWIFNITYNLNDGTNSDLNPTTYTENDEIILSEPTRTGYLFEGWYDNEEFTGDALTVIAKGSSGAKKIWAKWTTIYYTITYVLDDKGTNSELNPVTYTIEDEISFVPPSGNDQWGFGGWFTTEKCKGADIKGIKKGSHKDIILYALWLENFDGSVFIEGGTFTMGRTLGSGIENELPTHSVTVSDFYMSPYEMTQKIYVEIMGTNPSYHDKDKESPTDIFNHGYADEIPEERPVEMVSWYDVIYFCNKYSEAKGFTPCYSVDGSTDVNTWGYTPHNENSINGTIDCDFTASGYRLPTEAEWEYAAKGGKNQDLFIYSGSDNIDDVASCYNTANGFSLYNPPPHQVGIKTCNSLGLYDMTGNVQEWCWDWYGSYSVDSQNNPTGKESGNNRVLRGGCYTSQKNQCTCSYRDYSSPNKRYSNQGFRVVRSSTNEL